MNGSGEPIEIIVETPAMAGLRKSAPFGVVRTLQRAGIRCELVAGGDATARKGRFHAGLVKSRLLLRTEARETEANPWDMAHLCAKALGASAGTVEPNRTHGLVVRSKSDRGEDGHDPDWKPAADIVWHLGDRFSQLARARAAVGEAASSVRIAHLDTGYSLTHPVIPAKVREHPLQRNFVMGERIDDAHDPLEGGLLRMPGHGTGTFGILAGPALRIETGEGPFLEPLGGAPLAEVVSLRIAGSVVLLKTYAFAEALSYLTGLSRSGSRVDVVSMSMGGAPSRLWADAVNEAYDAGILLVSAAGNNFNGLPTRNLVYPARFGRVIAACGVTYDRKPYFHRKPGEMQGCYGPEKDMGTAMAAFTPNLPWASVESGGFRFSGGGTSCATPQIAAAAALYIGRHREALGRLQPWQRVEAVRHALFSTAAKSTGLPATDRDFPRYFGNGILKAADALECPVTVPAGKTPEDRIPLFPILGTLSKSKAAEGYAQATDLLNTELAALCFAHPALAEPIDHEKGFEAVGARKWKAFRDAVAAHPDASEHLRRRMQAPRPPAGR